MDDHAPLPDLPRWDGHVHSGFCPHGTPPPTARFLARAHALGFSRVTLLEHAPLPAAVADPTPARDNNLAPERLAPFLRHAAALRERWRGRLDVRVALEVELLAGHEDHARRLIDRHGGTLDEVVCAVHLLPDGAGGWGSLDCSPETFGELARRAGSVAALRRRYFAALAEQVERDPCAPLPRRLGHPLLVDKFRLLFPPDPAEAGEEDARAAGIAAAAAARGWGLDLDTAGLRRPHCGVPYLRGTMLEAAARHGAAVVFGSDAHRPEEVGAGWAEAQAEWARAQASVRSIPLRNS